MRELGAGVASDAQMMVRGINTPVWKYTRAGREGDDMHTVIRTQWIYIWHNLNQALP